MSVHASSRALIGLVLVAAGLSLAGCTPEPIEPVELDALSCVDASWNGGPARDAVVACTSPHLFDVVTSLGAWHVDPADDRDDGLPVGDLYERLVRADDGDELVTDYTAWAQPACENALRTLLGLDAISVGDATAEQLAPRVDGRYTVITSLSTRSAYARGDRTTLCSVGWLGENGGLVSRSHQPGADLRALAGPGLSLSERECILFAGGTTRPVDCTQPHSGQVIVDVDALAALGRDWVASVDPSTGLPISFLAADDAGEAVLTGLVPQASFGDGRGARAAIRPTDAWVGFDGTVIPGARYPLSCAVAVVGQASLMEGDVWGELTEATAEPLASPGE
jgi:hypothetical protein